MLIFLNIRVNPLNIFTVAPFVAGPNEQAGRREAPPNQRIRRRRGTPPEPQKQTPRPADDLRERNEANEERKAADSRDTGGGERPQAEGAPAGEGGEERGEEHLQFAEVQAGFGDGDEGATDRNKREQGRAPGAEEESGRGERQAEEGHNGEEDEDGAAAEEVLFDYDESGEGRRRPTVVDNLLQNQKCAGEV